MAEGKNLIDLGIGDPDLPTPKPIIEELKKRVRMLNITGIHWEQVLYNFVRQWQIGIKDGFDVELEPKSEVVTLIGSKEGIGHIPLAFVNREMLFLCQILGILYIMQALYLQAENLL